METQIKSNLYTGLFMAILGFVILAALFSACQVEELPPPKAPDMHVVLDAGAPRG